MYFHDDKQRKIKAIYINMVVLIIKEIPGRYLTNACLLLYPAIMAWIE
jgi:hypothetical protein